MKENIITDIFGNELKEGDIIVIPERKNGNITIKEYKCVYDPNSNELSFFNESLNSYIYIWFSFQLGLIFWLKGCKQIYPQPEPNLVKQFESDLDNVLRKTTKGLFIENGHVEYKQFIDKYTPYLQPHKTDKDGN